MMGPKIPDFESDLQKAMARLAVDPDFAALVSLYDEQLKSGHWFSSAEAAPPVALRPETWQAIVARISRINSN
jgi:hypothetical protein